MKTSSRIKLIKGAFDCDKYIGDFIKVIECYKSDKMGDSPPYSQKEKDNLIKLLGSDSGQLTFFIYHEDEIAGCALCFKTFSSFSAKPVINIHDICILTEFRGMGYGRLLMNEVISYAGDIECSKVTLEVRDDNHRAQSLYKSLDFQECNPPMYFWNRSIHN